MQHCRNPYNGKANSALIGDALGTAHSYTAKQRLDVALRAAERQNYYLWFKSPLFTPADPSGTKKYFESPPINRATVFTDIVIEADYSAEWFIILETFRGVYNGFWVKQDQLINAEFIGHFSSGFFGGRGQVLQHDWLVPHVYESGTRIVSEIQWLNAGFLESAPSVLLKGIQPLAPATQTLSGNNITAIQNAIATRKPETIIISVDVPLTGTSNEIVDVFTPQSSEPLLVYAMGFNANTGGGTFGNCFLSVQDTMTGGYWNNDKVPIWGYANGSPGTPKNVQTYTPLPTPHLLVPDAQLRCKVQNTDITLPAEFAGKIEFLCRTM